MKKIILLSAIIGFGICAFAGQPLLSDALNNKKVHKDALPTIHVNDALQSSPFFSEDFSAGIPAGWTNVDNSGNNVLWRTTSTGALNTTTPVDEQLNPAGTSASNGYLILDSDSAGSVIENTDLTTVAINCSGHSTVHLIFNEYFAQYGSSTGKVKVSNDNVTWVPVHNAETGLGPDSGTANPYTLDFDISATAANQSTVYLRFTYTGDNDYWWFVDDVQLVEPSATDLAVFSIEKPDEEYTKIPLTQATELTLSAVVKNTGLSASGGGTALLELVDAGSALTVFSEVVNLNTLAPGGTQTVYPSLAFAPPAAAMYKSRVTVSVAGDGNAANNSLESDQLEISDSVYQRDDEVFAGVQPIGFGPGADGTAGQSFMVHAEGDISSVTFFLKDTFSFGASGTPLYFTVHPQLNATNAPDGATVLGTTDTLMLFDGMIPMGGGYYTLHLNGGVHVIPGLYFIGFHEVDGLIPMGYSNNIITPNAVWAYASSMGWFKPEDFGFYLSYMIRANFGMLPDAVTEIRSKESMFVYPNPSAGVFAIRFDKQDGAKDVVVFNALGELVYQNKFVAVANGVVDLSQLSNGVYSVCVSQGNQSVNKLVSVLRH